jgi:hypothetical protein
MRATERFGARGLALVRQDLAKERGREASGAALHDERRCQVGRVLTHPQYFEELAGRFRAGRLAEHRPPVHQLAHAVEREPDRIDEGLADPRAVGGDRLDDADRPARPGELVAELVDRDRPGEIALVGLQDHADRDVGMVREHVAELEQVREGLRTVVDHADHDLSCFAVDQSHEISCATAAPSIGGPPSEEARRVLGEGVADDRQVRHRSIHTQVDEGRRIHHLDHVDLVPQGDQHVLGWSSG